MTQHQLVIVYGLDDSNLLAQPGFVCVIVFLVCDSIITPALRVCDSSEFQ